MRWTLIVASTLAVVLAVTALATASLRPVLRVGTAHAVRGSHFKAYELVRVVFTSDVRQVRVIRVSADGSFATALPTPVHSCSGMLIRATGASGDIASIALSTGLCPPPSASAGTTPGGGGTTPGGGGTTPGGGGTAPGGGDTAPPSSTGGLPDPHGPATTNPGG
jgi:hypothetical protein